MKVLEISRSEAALAKHDYRNYYAIVVNDVKQCTFRDGEPEDANISRDFSDVYNIVRLMKMAHEAGKNGEPFEVESKEVD